LASEPAASRAYKVPPQLGERLLLGALDVDSAGLRGVLAELDVSPLQLRQRVAATLRLAR